MNKKTILVTSVGAPPGLNTLRILSEVNNYNLIGVDADRYACGLYLKNIKPYIIPLAHEKQYIPALLDICKKEQVNVLLPCYENEILKISEYRSNFYEQKVNLLLPSHKTLLACCNKSKTIEQAKKARIPHPKTYLIQKKPEIKNVDLDFPVVIKPCFGSGARDVSYPKNQNELFIDYQKLSETHKDILVQELIPGSSGTVYMCGLLYDNNHNLKASFLSRSLKTLYKTGGPGTVGEPVKNKEIIQLAKNLIQSFGDFSGPAGIEFKIDERDNVPKLMEINPRLWGYSRLSFVAGINIHKMTIQLALGEDVPEAYDYDTNKLLVRMYDDRVFDKEEIQQKVVQI